MGTCKKYGKKNTNKRNATKSNLKDNKLKATIMNNEKELLGLYHRSDNFRVVLRQPFLQDGRVCATDGYMLIRICAALCEGDYQERPGGLLPPNTANVIPVPNTDEPLTYRKLKIALNATPDEHSRRCPECNGEGVVTWEYRDKSGEYHKQQDTCPVCDGAGELVDEYTAVKYQYTIHGATLCLHHVKTLLRTMEHLHTKTLRLRHFNDKGECLLFGVEGKDIEILIMPQMRKENLVEVKII